MGKLPWNRYHILFRDRLSSIAQEVDFLALSTAPIASQIQSRQVYKHSCASASLLLLEMLSIPDIITSARAGGNCTIPWYRFARLI